MILKWIGAILVIGSCGGFGLVLITQQIHESEMLKQCDKAVDRMICELQYHLTPLPVLCRDSAMMCRGAICDVLMRFAEELDAQLHPNVEECMEVAIQKFKPLPDKVLIIINELGSSLGKYDIQGQLSDLKSVKQKISCLIESFESNKRNRLRGYQTLALCAGAALVILFI